MQLGNLEDDATTLNLMENVFDILGNSTFVRCHSPDSLSGHSFSMGPLMLKGDKTTWQANAICTYCGKIIIHDLTGLTGVTTGRTEQIQ